MEVVFGYRHEARRIVEECQEDIARIYGLEGTEVREICDLARLKDMLSVDLRLSTHSKQNGA